MHDEWMRQAIEEAQKAFSKGEVPVGAIVVQDGEVIGRGHNLVETFQDPTGHAEILALTSAANRLASWRLEQAALYVTLEPCPMCLGAAQLARISRLVFGAMDPRLGACGSAVDLRGFQPMTQMDILGGVLAEESRKLLQAFFRSLRTKKEMGQ